MSELIVKEVGADKGREVPNRTKAEEVKANMEGLGLDVEITTKDENGETKADGGPEVETAESIETVETEEVEATETDVDEQIPEEPPIDADPVDWLPSHFVDTIEGVPTLNRKGYAVMCKRFGVSVRAEPVTLASETDRQYAEFKAVAETRDGTEYTGFGSAHVDRNTGDGGDDPYLLNEMAETRAMKRAGAWATGVGLTAAEEMRGEL